MEIQPKSFSSTLEYHQFIEYFYGFFNQHVEPYETTPITERSIQLSSLLNDIFVIKDLANTFYALREDNGSRGIENEEESAYHQALYRLESDAQKRFRRLEDILLQSSSRDAYLQRVAQNK